MRVFRTLLTFLLLFVAFFMGFSRAPKTRSLTTLPVPNHVSTLSYSGPLILPLTTYKNILGAETISPVEFVEVINRERENVNAPPLRLNTTLMRAAKLRADVMRDHQNFSHQDPYEHIELGTVLPKLNYRFVYAEENIGMGGVSAPDFVNGFMNSSRHRQALLDPRFTETGAAFTDGPYDRWYVNYAVQIFAIPNGTDEYLGYNSIQKETYESMLAAVEENLNPLLWTVARLSRNPRYTDTYYRSLTRQRMILRTIVPIMQKQKPLTNEDVSLILEYNGLLAS